MTKLVFTACLLLLLLVVNGGHHVVEARRHRERSKDYMLFVFGDSFADVGNRPRTSQRTAMSRAWFYPYGMSDSDHGNRPTGRVSDGMVQSDILAMILGGDESPPPSRQTQRDPSGVNFAVGGSGVFSGEAASLRQQVEQLASLVNRGIVEAEDLAESVALVAVSTGHDYAGRITHESSSNDMRALTSQVTDEIAGAVMRLRDLGVSKILVNLLPALGCMPWQSVGSHYSQCDSQSNTLASMHNTALRNKLEAFPQDVLVLDLYTAFSNAQPAPPCCSNPDPSGYCGQEDANGRPQYTVCADPDSAFFWDYIHPTQAGWETIMEQLVQPIQQFLGIQSSW
ncbi:unnamed protein product [Urochloa decumbens]|uniref:GDSL esterase/lipase n=1 Tax=Urochloa decumbens TaxID=240449 RepID=A0ABC9HFK5_9POAL